MALAVTVTYIDAPAGSKFVEVYGTLAFSGSYTTGGEAITWQGLGNAGTEIPSSQAPLQVFVQSQGGSGWLYGWNAGSAKVQVFGQHPTNATTGIIALEELAAASYPSGVTGDTVVFEAIFLKLQ
jgi:hypothetical protein